ncbi:glycosyltransferase family 2 protein [Amycolatopsis sp. SID8362]|uniref:glycosyltransferase family 2 protein n=1 Tax=Amycolatopsis sp. SID8362 TaxID=2690346 RepID=UPI00136AD4C3|nr:glycosyltransferase family 2 protein [Amycolatopsis sp. SID8362]NBH08560.1 glycosyltransferase [Amycolatopsis sp. SID8362]NED45254.1 glycosyltransferase family 2 protein [Amycolatopsis sp. SID8362]
MLFPNGAARSVACTVVVPTFDAAELLERCVLALHESIGDRDDVELVVSDDGSTDRTPDVVATLQKSLPRPVISVRSEANLGFSHACNAGARAASGRHLVFYNNDLLPTPGWLGSLLTYADSDPGRAVVGTRLLFPDGRLQHCGVVICTDGYPRHVYAGLPGDHELAMRSGRAHIVTAACMLVRSAVFAELGGFDTGYRNGYEDVDLCLRAEASGHAVHYCHSSVLTHWVSATREQRTEEFAATEQVFLDRWGRLPPTDVERYVRDGMLNLNYGRTFPLHITASPELAFVETADSPSDTGSTVAELRDLVHRLRRENVELRMRALGREGDQP